MLLIDDDPVSRELLGVVLDAGGLQTVAFESGAEALKLLGEKDPSPVQAILTDLRMPGISGVELAAALRDAAPEGTLLLAMSASRPEAAVAASFDAFLLKPFTPEQVREAIASAQERASASKQGGSLSISAQAEEDAASPGAKTSETIDLDAAVRDKLSAIMPANQLGDLYRTCISDARERIARMRSAAAEGDAAEFRKEAHAIKGGCSMLGAREMAALASAMENAAQPWSALGAMAETDKFLVACERLESIL